MRLDTMLRTAVVAAILWIPCATASADPSVVGDWRFDEGSGLVAADSSGLGNNGALSGGATWVPGVVGGAALSFDGLTGQVRVPNSTSLEPAQVTVAAWVRRTGSPGAFKYVVSKGGAGCISSSYGLYTGPHGGLVFYVSTSKGTAFALSPDAGGGVWDGNWHLATGTFDATSVRLFLDGVEIGSGTPWANPISYGLPESNDLFFGAYLTCPGLDYPGVIDEPEVWNRALSVTDIKSMFPFPGLRLAPSAATVIYGASQTYTAEGFDAHANDVGDVTSATMFAIAAEGPCAAAACTPAGVGTHTVTGTDGGSSGSATLNVTPRSLSVAANNATRVYGVANPVLSSTITGFVAGQTLATSGVSGAAACTSTATPTSAPGTYPITCTTGSLAATNYSFPPTGFAAATLTVTLAPTSIAADPITLRRLASTGPSFRATLTASATNVPLAGLTVVFTLSVAPHTIVCTATTNAAGLAGCGSTLSTILPVLLSSSYSASFAGNVDYQASTKTARVDIL